VKTILLWSGDGGFVRSFSEAVSASEQLVIARLHDNSRRLDVAAGHLIVWDCRSEAQDALTQIIAQRQADMNFIPHIIVARRGVVSRIRVISYARGGPLDIVVPDSNALPLVARAYLNNTPRGAEAALAASILEEALPAGAMGLVNASLCSGFAASTVKECASALGCDRGTVRRHLYDGTASGMTPRAVLDMAKAVYAIVLLRTTSTSLTAVAPCLRYSSTTSVALLLKRTLGVSIQQARSQFPEEPTDVVVARLIGAALARTAQTLTDPCHGDSNDSPFDRSMHSSARLVGRADESNERPGHSFETRSDRVRRAGRGEDGPAPLRPV
jgi:AraC-like DNA-binding protein